MTLTGAADAHQGDGPSRGIGFVHQIALFQGASQASTAPWVSDAGFDALFTTFQFHSSFMALPDPALKPASHRGADPGLTPAPASQDLFATPYQPSAIAGTACDAGVPAGPRGIRCPAGAGGCRGTRSASTVRRGGTTSRCCVPWA